MLPSNIPVNPIKEVYIVASGHPLWLKQGCDRILDAALPVASRAFNFDALDIGGLTANQLIAACQTLPMMAQRRVVMVRELHRLPAAELRALESYLKDPSPSTTLIVTTQKLDKRLNFYKLAQKVGCLYSLDAPKDPRNWLTQYCREHAITITSSAITRLIAAMGNDISQLGQACHQLALYAGKGNSVEPRHVDEVIAHTKEESVFALTEALGNGKIDKAIDVAMSVSRQGQSAIGVVALLGRFVRQLLLCKTLDGKSSGDKAKAIGVPPFVVAKLERQHRNYSVASLCRLMELLSKSDGRLKGSGGLSKCLAKPLIEEIVLLGLVDQFATEFQK